MFNKYHINSFLEISISFKISYKSKFLIFFQNTNFATEKLYNSSTNIFNFLDIFDIHSYNECEIFPRLLPYLCLISSLKFSSLILFPKFCNNFNSGILFSLYLNL